MTPGPSRSHAIRLLLAAAGVSFLAYLVWKTGVEALLAPIRTLSWRIVLLFVVPDMIVITIATLAWRCAFLQTSVPLRRLFPARLAGEALNLGTLSVGGEPVKAYLLRPIVPLVEASAAQFIDKTSITAGQVLFLVLGLAVAVPLFDVPGRFLSAMGVLLLVQIAVVAAFVLVQRAGIVRASVRIGRWLGMRDLGPRLHTLIRVEQALATAYRDRPGRVLTCVLIHLLGWVVNSVEIYLVLGWVGAGVSFPHALVIDAFGTGVKFMAFAIPGAVGALEGGYMLAFGAMGVGSGLGLSCALIRRLRMLAWGMIGLVVLVIEQRPGAERSRAHGAASRS